MLFKSNGNVNNKVSSEDINIITTPPDIDKTIIKCKFCSDMEQTNSNKDCSCGWDWY